MIFPGKMKLIFDQNLSLLIEYQYPTQNTD